jgi:hypothetical protein
MELDTWAGPDGSLPSNMPRVDASNESKREKRRREMAVKVERIRQETIERKDSIHADLQESYRIHLNAMLTLPYPTHPEYLLRLHALSVQRDADTLAARLESTYALETARQLYHTEVDRVEEEYESAKKAIKEKLLEACDERAKKLKEEKDSLDLPSLEGGLYGDNGKHATRRRGVNGFSNNSPGHAGPSSGASSFVYSTLLIPTNSCVSDSQASPCRTWHSPHKQAAIILQQQAVLAIQHPQEDIQTQCNQTSPHPTSAIHSTIPSFPIHQHSQTTLYILPCSSYNQEAMPYFNH